MSEVKQIPLSKLEVNNGQIAGLPKNPRFIKDYKFQKLKKSLEDSPEMLHLRELIVFPHGDKFVIISGNMMYTEKSVLELFGGTGTTLIAAEQLNRKCFICELDPHYCDIILTRWEKLTGGKAEKITD